MPRITPPQAIGLGARKPDNQTHHKFIKVSLEVNKDMIDTKVSLLVDGDWFNSDLFQCVNGRSQEIDISQQMRSGGMLTCQSVYIENSAGIGIASIKCLATGHMISCPPGHQGWFPIIAPKEDGKFLFGYDDKYNALAQYEPSWARPSQVIGNGSTVVPPAYTLDFFFTDLAVPPTIWPAISEYGLLGYGDVSDPFDDAFIFLPADIDTPLTPGSGDRRFSVRVRADETCLTYVIISAHDYGSNLLKDVWIILPGEHVIFDGRHTPVNDLYARSIFEDGFAQFCYYV